MFITCPNCNTRFSIPDGALGDKGRTLKCAKCGHKWFQSADTAADEEQQSAVTPATEPSKSEPSPPPKEIVLPSPPAAAESLSDSFDAIPPPPPPPPSAADAPPPPPPPAKKAAAQTKKIDSLDFDEFDLDFGVEEKSEPAPMPSTVPGITFPPPFVPTGRRKKIVDFDLLIDEASPDDLPSALNRKNIPKEILVPKKSGIWWSCAGVASVVLAIFGAYAFQQDIIHRWPGTAYFYEKTFLLKTSLPGAGLVITDQNVNWLAQDKTQSLVIRGTLVNMTTQSRPFPGMVLNLYSNDGRLRQTQTIPPLENNLSGGERYQFRYVLSDPDPLAAAINISFVAAVQPTPAERQETQRDVAPDVVPTPRDSDVVPSPGDSDVVPSPSDPDVVPAPD